MRFPLTFRFYDEDMTCILDSVRTGNLSVGAFMTKSSASSRIDLVVRRTKAGLKVRLKSVGVPSTPKRPPAAFPIVGFGRETEKKSRRNGKDSAL
jgi:hypothetical protein